MKNVSLLAIGGILGAMTIRGDANASIVSRNFLENALTDYAKTTALDLKANQSDLTALSNKIGTLPSAILPSAWTDIPYYSENGVNMPDAGFPLPTTIGEQLEFLFNGGPESPIERMFMVMTIFGGNVNADDDPGADFLGLVPLTQKVKNIEENITLPSGEIIPSKGLAFLLPEPPNSTYPTSIGDFMEQMYTGYWGISGLAEAVYHGNVLMGQTDTARQVKGLRQITDEIGTLPSGNFLEFPGSEFLSNANLPLTYPTSLAELITAIYGNSETGAHGLLAAIIAGFLIDTDGDGQFDSNIGTLSNYSLAKYAIDLANANTAKIGTVPDGKNLAGMIGTLPAGYDSVGAALTAIKGIAEEAKAAAVAAIPDPKAEGSSGKYVLTVDIIGDNATYRWEKIDRSESESTTTE